MMTSKAVRLVTILVKLLGSWNNDIHSVTSKDAIRQVLLKAAQYIKNNYYLLVVSLRILQ